MTDAMGAAVVAAGWGTKRTLAGLPHRSGALRYSVTALRRAGVVYFGGRARADERSGAPDTLVPRFSQLELHRRGRCL